MALGYANRTQAEKAIAKLGEGWSIYHVGQPFYIAKTNGDRYETKSKSKKSMVACHGGLGPDGYGR